MIHCGPLINTFNTVTNNRVLIIYALFQRTARCLRLLATEHVFTEVAPDVFANNRISSVIDTGKDIEDIMSKYVLLSLLLYSEAPSRIQQS